MDLQTVLDWYRSALLAVMPGIAGWRVEQGVYWLPISAGVGLCATSDGARTQVELCRGLTGESLLSIEHVRGVPFQIREAAAWISNCVGRLVRETEEVLQAFGADTPLQLGAPMNAAIPIPAEVRVAQPPADTSGWDLHKAPLFYETPTDLVSDLRVFPCGSVVVFLHRDPEEALNLTTQLILGDQARPVPTHNPLYYVTEADAPRVLGAMRRAGLSPEAIDRLRVRPETDTGELGLFARDPQFVVVSLRDQVGSNRFDAHLREVIGTDDEDRIPLYHIIFAEATGPVNEAVDAIRQIDTLPVTSHIYLIERSFLFHLVWTDNKIRPEKRPLRDRIYLPPFIL